MYTILACAQQFDSDPLRNFKIGSERFNPTAATGPLADHVAGGVRGSPGFMDELKIRGIEKQWILQDDFFADVVTRWAQPGTESDLYKVTIPLWEFLPGRSPDVDALMYPSVQHNLHAFNLALKLDAASVIRPVEAWVIDVREVVDRALPGERDLFGPITHRGEILEDGSIDWSPGDWSIQQVRTQFRQRVGVAPEIAGVSPILKYSEEEIDARRDEREKPNRTC